MAKLTNGLWAVLFLAGAIYALMIEPRAQDEAFYAHGFLFLLFCVAGFAAVLRYGSSQKPAPADPSARPDYNEAIVKAGVLASTFWGIVGFATGLWIALQLAFPVLNFDLPWTNFGRLRPVHTSAVIFAFGGNVLLTCPP
jgi:cytochrome c oxidase cbb3-type subunit 1